MEKIVYNIENKSFDRPKKFCSATIVKIFNVLPASMASKTKNLKCLFVQRLRETFNKKIFTRAFIGKNYSPD